VIAVVHMLVVVAGMQRLIFDLRLDTCRNTCLGPATETMCAIRCKRGLFELA